MDCLFVFIDDTEQKETKLCSLTGVLVPSATYRAARDDFYAILRPFYSDEKRMGMPPELHGSDLLPNEPDETKLGVYRQVVALLNRHRLRVLRVGVYESELFREPSSEFYGVEHHKEHVWFEFMWKLQVHFADSLVIPVMDLPATEERRRQRLDRVRRYSHSAHFAHSMRGAGRGEFLSIKGTENLFAEMLFADSRSAVLVQLADLVSWMLNVHDLVHHERKLGPFKQRVLEVASELEEGLIERHLITMNVHWGVEPSNESP